MKRQLLLVALLLSAPAWAEPKDCTELLIEIAQMVRDNGLPDGFVLEVVPRAQLEQAQQRHDWLVVGWCENGTKFIVYRKMK